jgi:hypothetical protein
VLSALKNIKLPVGSDLLLSRGGLLDQCAHWIYQYAPTAYSLLVAIHDNIRLSMYYKPEQGYWETCTGHQFLRREWIAFFQLQPLFLEFVSPEALQAYKNKVQACTVQPRTVQNDSKPYNMAVFGAFPVAAATLTAEATRGRKRKAIANAEEGFATTSGRASPRLSSPEENAVNIFDPDEDYAHEDPVNNKKRKHKEPRNVQHRSKRHDTSNREGLLPVNSRT